MNMLYQVNGTDQYKKRTPILLKTDGVLLLLYIALVIVGILSVFSVEYKTTDPSIFMMTKSHMKQAIWFGVSLFTGLIILYTDSKFFSSISFLAYGVCVLLMIVTIFAGVSTKGSHSWLALGPVKFQPGEIGKIFTALALSRFLSFQETNFKRFKDRCIGLAIAFIPAVFIILQNETGLALVYFSFVLVLYREGLPNAILISIFAIGFLTIATLLLSTTSILILIVTITAV
jgi:rod shape determining protein RodA